MFPIFLVYLLCSFFPQLISAFNVLPLLTCIRCLCVCFLHVHELELSEDYRLKVAKKWLKDAKKFLVLILTLFRCLSCAGELELSQDCRLLLFLVQCVASHKN